MIKKFSDFINESKIEYSKDEIENLLNLLKSKLPDNIELAKTLYKSSKTKIPEFDTILGIIETTEELEIDNYTINSDFTIDVEGNVRLNYKKFKKLPLNFNKVKGTFIITGTELITLKGFPKEVFGDFICNFNNLSSLEGCPEIIGKDFICTNNKLKSLEYGPLKVGGSYNCSDNNLTSLEGCPKNINKSFYSINNKLVSLKGSPKYVNGDFNCSNNKLTSLEGGPIRVDYDYNIENNNLKSLANIAEYIGGFLDVSGNPDLEIIETPKGLEGKLYK